MTSENKTLFKVNNIYLAKEFYGIQKDINKPQYHSTLAWKPGVVTNARGEATFEYLTGELTGNFRIIRQGISFNDVIFATSEVSVN